MQPTPFANPLFKTSSSDSPQGQPVSSPFAVPGQAPATLLTVGDVLPQLPPEIARAGSVAPDQPIHVAPHTIEAALSSGQAALPMFEIYRVCPAIFQTPVSPQDPRLVPLPPSKIPALIAAASSGSSNHARAPISGSPTVPNSPFGQTMGLTGASIPFAPAAPSAPLGAPSSSPDQPTSAFGAMRMPAPEADGRAPTALPPKRPAGTPPPSLAPGLEGLGTADGLSNPFSMPSVPAAGMRNPDQQPAAPPSNPNPFASVPEAGPAQPPPSSSTSLFGTPPAVQPVVFGAMQPVSEPPAEPMHPAPFSIPFSPFSSSPPSASPLPPAITPAAMTDPAPPATFAQPTPPLAPAGNSPFQAGANQPAPKSIFGVTASPPSEGPAEAPSSPSGPVAQHPLSGAPTEFGKATSASPFPAMDRPASAPAEAPSSRLSLSAVLKGYGQGDLGIDPNMIPSWITTQVQPGQFRRSETDGSWQVELGALVDGVTDVGFRNLLAAARRQFVVAVTEEASAPGSQTPSQPAASNPSHTMAPGTAHTPHSMVIEPMKAAGAPPPADLKPGGTDASLQHARAIVQPAPGAQFGFPSAPPEASTQPTAPSPAPTAPTAQPIVPQSAAAESRPLAASGFDPFAAPTGLWHAPASQTDSDQGGLSSEQLFGAPPKPGVSNPISESTLGQEKTPMFQATRAETPTSSPTLPHASEPAPLPPLSALPEIQMPPAANQAPPVPLAAGPVEPLVEATQPRRKESPLLARLAESTLPNIATPEPVTSISPAPVDAPALTAPAPVRQVAPEAPRLNFSSPIGSDDQLLLRALLGVDESLTPHRVVELTAALPGISACALVLEGKVLTGGRATKTAQDFQQQAGSLAGGIRSLAPLIGIADAETFTLNAQDRLITFCFPDGATMGVLHEDLQQPAAGLRDKVTLIARELAKMVKA